MALFIPTYFSPISQYQALLNSNSITFEVEDNYQKQTYRNRCYIYGANGKQLLNIPVTIPKSSKKTKSKDILVENANWQKQHYKSLEAAYNHSPFFEFYKDDLRKIFSKKYTYLLDVNLDSFKFIMDALELFKEYTLSKTYEETKLNDFRNLADSKKKVEISFLSYIQMFDQKFGFLKNLSILDLLFMEGPNSINFLEK
jgi:hypothetical protein